MLAAFYRKNIPGLDGVRALSVTLVILYHFGFSSIPGGHGVLVFFVLSGFLITWLMLDEQERTGTVSLRQFYWRRAVRILPALLAFLFVALLLLVASGRPVLWNRFACALLYVANYYNVTHTDAAGNGILGHLWSLAIEEQFYLLWPVAFIALHRRSGRGGPVIATAILCVWIYRTIAAISGADTRYIYHAFETRADHLLTGCLAAIVVRRGLFPRFWRLAVGTPWRPFASLGLLAGSALYGHEHHIYRNIVGYALDPVLAAIAIVQLVVLSATPQWRWLQLPAVRHAGRISYSLYLYQQIGVSPYILPGRPLPIRFGVCILVTFALASASYYFIEKPFLRLKLGPAAPKSDPAELGPTS
jgi:peptidoglycan/LPS O-acetylase OafA/YrhL